MRAWWDSWGLYEGPQGRWMLIARIAGVVGGVVGVVLLGWLLWHEMIVQLRQISG